MSAAPQCPICGDGADDTCEHGPLFLFSALSPAQLERLAFFVEECGEAIKAAMKIIRHGYESYDPTKPRRVRINNRADLEIEMGDIRAAMILLCNAKDTDKEFVHARANEKLDSVRRWMHHQ